MGQFMFDCALIFFLMDEKKLSGCALNIVTQQFVTLLI